MKTVELHFFFLHDIEIKVSLILTGSLEAIPDDHQPFLMIPPNAR